MITGLRGQALPEDAEDFDTLVASLAETHLNCRSCRTLFSAANTHSVRGWRETQISGMCEDCYDKLFSALTPTGTSFEATMRGVGLRTVFIDEHTDFSKLHKEL